MKQTAAKIACLLTAVLLLSACTKQSEPLPPAPIKPEITAPESTSAPAPEIPTLELPTPELPAVPADTDNLEARSTMPELFIPENPNVPVGAELDIAEGFAFTKCDTRWQFKQADWYDRFVDRLVNIDGMSEKNIATICLSNDEELVIAMLNGKTDETGGVVRYEIRSNVLSLATFTKDMTPFFFYRFKGRVGTIIPMEGGVQADACDSLFTVNYDFAKNTLKPIRECKTCDGAAEVCERL